MLFYFYDLRHKNTSENLSLLKVEEAIKKSTYYLSTNDNTVVKEKATAKKSIM